MPKYVSITGLRERHGSEYLAGGISGDALEEGQDVDPESVSWAIRDAEAEVDMYLDRRNVLPLDGVEDREDPENNSAVPDSLRRIVADIAFYRLAAEHELLTEEKIKRHDKAIRDLEAFEKTGRGLGIEGKAPKGDVVTVTSRTRLFTRADGGVL